MFDFGVFDMKSSRVSPLFFSSPEPHAYTITLVVSKIKQIKSVSLSLALSLGLAGSICVNESILFCSFHFSQLDFSSMPKLITFIKSSLPFFSTVIHFHCLFFFEMYYSLNICFKLDLLISPYGGLQPLYVHVCAVLSVDSMLSNL